MKTIKFERYGYGNNWMLPLGPISALFIRFKRAPVNLVGSCCLERAYLLLFAIAKAPKGFVAIERKEETVRTPSITQDGEHLKNMKLGFSVNC